MPERRIHAIEPFDEGQAGLSVESRNRQATGIPDPASELRRLRWAKPLRVHLSVIIVLLLVAISVPLIWLTFQEGRQSALESARQQMRLLSRSTLDLYAGLLQDGHSIITMGAVLPSLIDKPPAYVFAKREYLVRALKSSPHIDAVYVGYPNGAFFQVMRANNSPRWHANVSAPEETVFAMRVVIRDEDGRSLSTWHFLDSDGKEFGVGPQREVDYDPRRRPWYRAAIRADGPVSTAPYMSASTETLTLTMANSMVADKGIVIGVDVMLETISKMLVEQAVSENSVGFIFDDNGRLIVHSNPAIMAELAEQLSRQSPPKRAFAANDPELVAQIVARGSQPDAPTFDDPLLSAVQALLPAAGQSPSADLVEFVVGGKRWLARTASVSAKASHLLQGYSIVIAAPVSDFTADSIAQIKQKLLIAAAFVVLGVLLALLVSRRISRALVALADDASQIGNLDFQHWRASFSWIKEINVLERALGSARSAIGTFAVYVPRELVRQIVASGQDAAGAAVRREVTVLFTDIRDFTTISEQNAPEEVVDMLTAYFQTMNTVVERNNGVIVQYLGDSIYAMWNAPAENSDHVADGCRCALELKAAIDALNEENEKAGRPVLVTRFGLHTGIAVVGSVGAEDRRQYTAMGDTVNVASRLEGMNKQFGTTILTSAAVKAAAGTAGEFRPLGTATAKGRHEGIDIFELLEPRNKA